MLTNQGIRGILHPILERESSTLGEFPMRIEDELNAYVRKFLAQYETNGEGGYDGVDEKLVAMQRSGWCLREVEEGESRMLQETATMRFVG